MLDKELILFVELQAQMYAKDKDYFMPIIKGRLLTYLNAYIDFVNENSKKFKVYLQENKNKFIDEENKFTYNNFWELIKFLNSARKLLNDEYKIVEEYFNKYQKFSSIEKFKEWKSFVDYADEKLKLKGIKKLHDYLQFVIALYKVEEIRVAYLKEILIKVIEEEKEIKIETLEKKEKLFERSKSLQKQKNYFNQAGY